MGRREIGVELNSESVPPSGPPAADGTSSAARLAFRRLRTTASAEDLFCALYGESEPAFWLHSALLRDGLSRFSFMGDAQADGSQRLSYRSDGRRLEVYSAGQAEFRQESLFDYLARELERRPCAAGELPFDFAGGFVGYFGYELKQECGGSPAHRSTLPDAALLYVERFLAYDHARQEVYLVARVDDGQAAPEAWFDALAACIASAPAAPSPIPAEGEAACVDFRLRDSRSVYLDKIREAQDHIAAGDSYQVCLTNRLDAAVELHPLTLYRILQQVNPAPFSAFLRFPGVAILSASPERFLSIDRERRVQAKPIKGTARRSADPEEDRRLAEQLQADDKNRAENVMIVDLLRNDLGRVCDLGSVEVRKLLSLESYATVHQLVSTIEGRLANGRSVLDGLRAAFPGGSMTGAPKIWTMAFLDRLEAAARGPYSGAIGYLSLGGAADLSIVIRTIVATPGHVSIGVGGGIVADSVPAAEFDEAMLKAQALLEAVGIAATGRAGDRGYRIVDTV